MINLSWLIDDKNSKLDRRHPYKVGEKKLLHLVIKKMQVQ
jgi:hypothetical protein